MNRIDSLKQVHHFDAHNSNQKNEKEKRKHSVYNFSKYMQYYKIFQHEENLQIEYDYN